MKAIVYTSNTGYTKQYAEMLSERSGLPCYSADDAKLWVTKDSEVIYLGWLMAGIIMGYKKAAKRYKVTAVCAVGADGSGKQLENVRKTNKTGDIPLFVLQGGFDLKKLSGIYRLMMKAMIKTVGGRLEKKANKTAAEKDILALWKNGGSRVSGKRLKPILKELGLENGRQDKISE